MCLLYRTLPNPANAFMIISSFLCSFYVPFDNFVFSHKQNLCFLWLCKLKSGILHSRILVYDYFELFILFLSFIYTECAGKTGPPYCIFFIPAPTLPPSGHTPPKSTAPAPACAFSPPSSQPAARSRPRLRPPSQRQNTRRSSAVRSTGTPPPAASHLQSPGRRGWPRQPAPGPPRPLRPAPDPPAAPPQIPPVQ